MLFKELQTKAYEVYPATLIDSVFSHQTRNTIRTILLWISLFILIVIALEMVIDVPYISAYIFNIRGLFLLIFSVWLTMFLLECIYLSYYFNPDLKVDFSLSQIVLNTPEDDVTGAFLNSRVGKFTLLRLGIGSSELKAFLQARHQKIKAIEFMVATDENSSFVSIVEYGRSIIHFDQDFRKFLSRHSVTPEIFSRALMWVAKNQIKVKQNEYWWSMENLSRVPSLGKDWSFGQVYLLEKFGHSIFAEDAYVHLGDKWRFEQDIVNRLEQILVKESGANIILVAEDDNSSMESVASLAKTIVMGTALPVLESKRIYVLDGTSLIDSMKQKTEFELMFRNILAEANRVGNVILVIPRLARFAESSSVIGSHVEEILSEALSANNLHVIALADTKGFHSTLEPNHNLMRHFDRVIIEGFDDLQAMYFLEDEANYLEGVFKVFFTYQSLIAIFESAERYFSDGSLRDKAVNLMNELASKAHTENKVFILREDVLALVEQKTGIPQGKVDEEERDKLKNLEAVLHKKIVGQDSAITAIADALRRSRAGLSNPKRPIGSFLFLGPTGVGKTETTKALADVYFADESKIVRIDMSEYSSFGSVEKLIGSFNTGEPGILSSKLREKQYGILVLDEFEKTTKEVQDIFLQALDEGHFSDGQGEKVSLRNMIVIATSNAGSNLIYQLTKQGVDVSQKKKEIVDTLIENNIFKPELINRFDDVVVFHPLSENNLIDISKMMLERLNERLEHDGIVIEPSESLLEYLVATAGDTQFGAREMNRVVQDSIEKAIADSIIEGNIDAGDRITLEVKDGEIIVLKR